MTKLLEQALAQVRDLPEAEQDAVAEALFAHLTGREGYGLTEAQIEEVARRQREFQDGRTRNATDFEMADFWRRSGL